MRRQNLLTQVLFANLLLIVAAVVTAAVFGNPSFDVSQRPELALVLGFAVALTILVNVFMLQRRFRPLERLVDEMEKADLSRPANPRSASDGRSDPEEVARLEQAFRRMLERLEAERRSSSSKALAAQEEERARVARDLHDEVNQSLTGLLLRLEAARGRAGPELAHELNETKALANQAMEELLTLVRQLRPTALDDLGLKAALAGHVKELGRQGSTVKASFESRGDFSDLHSDVQLVVYRVAQEALSNAIQHSGAESVGVSLTRAGDRVKLTVNDDGRGFTFDQAARGLGIAGMRERALLVGGDLQVESRPGVGTRLGLTVPLGRADIEGRWTTEAEPQR